MECRLPPHDAERLKIALAARGIKLRDESELQDLLVEPVVLFILSLLRLATRQRDPEAWENLTHEIALLLGLDWEEDNFAIEAEAIACRSTYKGPPAVVSKHS